MRDLSDDGGCIDAAIDHLDSEIIAVLIRERINLLSEKERDTLFAVYGDAFFRKKQNQGEYAEHAGVTRSCVSARLIKAKRIIFRQSTKLYQYMCKDSYYKALLIATKAERRRINKRKNTNQKNIVVQKPTKIDNTIYNPLNYSKEHDPSLDHFFQVLNKLKNEGKTK